MYHKTLCQASIDGPLSNEGELALLEAEISKVGIEFDVSEPKNPEVDSS